MHPRIQELLEFIEVERARLRAAVDSVPAERRSEAPAPGQWSVAQVLEHLAAVEPRIGGLIRKRVAEGRAAGVGLESETSPILPTLDLDAFVVRETKIVAPTSIVPKGEVDAETAWNMLTATREDFRRAVIEADGVALGEIMHPHLTFGPLNLYRWIGFAGAHEARHADQIREIGAALA